MTSEKQFQVGDRAFSHYTMKWGTVEKVCDTRRGDTHGVTGDRLPDTTWYKVRNDDGSTDLLDDAHGDWDLARLLTPQIAGRYGYGADPKAPVCPDCGKPISLQPSGWWTHDGLAGDCWRQSMDGPNTADIC